MKKIVLIATLMLAVVMATACGNKKGNAYPSAGDTTGTPTASPDSGDDNTEIVHQCGGTVELAEYSALTKPEAYTGVSEEEIDEAFESEMASALLMYPNYEKDESHEATVIANGDVVNIDFVGKIDGVAFDGGSGEDYYLEVGSGQFIEDFEKGMPGHSLGETFDVTAVFPENYQNTDYAGKTAVFTITANHFGKEKEDPDDAYIARITSGVYTSVDQYREAVKEYLEDSAKAEYEGQVYGDLLDELIAKSNFVEILDEDVQYFEDDMYQYYTAQANQSGISLEDFAINNMGVSSLDEFLNQNHEEAIEIVKEYMITDAVAKKENIVVTEELYQQEMSKYVDESSGITLEVLEAYYTKDYLMQIAYQDLVDETIYKRVMGE